jgi:hypothetical protein
MPIYFSFQIVFTSDQRHTFIKVKTHTIDFYQWHFLPIRNGYSSVMVVTLQ